MPGENDEGAAKEKKSGAMKPRKVKAISLLLDSYLPEDLRDPTRVYDAKSVNGLLVEVARKYPEKYPEILKKIGDLGRRQAYLRGETFRIADLKPLIDRKEVFKKLDAEIARARRDIKDDGALERKLGEIFSRYSEFISKETQKKGLGSRNSVSTAVLSGARGKPAQFVGLMSTPGYYVDSQDRLIPMFVRHSFAEGVRPAEFLAGTYGARKSVTGSKRAVAKGGHLSKGLMRAGSETVVTEKDCGTSNGVVLPTSEKDIRGRVLQKPVAGLKAGTVLDKDALSRLSKAGAKEVVVRSPLTCGAEHGVCAKCMGLDAEHKFPKIGTHVGITSSNSLGEPLAQGSLNMKHQTAATGESGEYSGFEYLNQFVESPETFKDRAVVAEKEGRVGKVEEAPQGGWNIEVAGDSLYIPPERKILVKEGDDLEAGDRVTDGLIDPEDVVRLRGLGEGRKYYAKMLAEISKASGAAGDLRNFEVMARSNLDHVELEDPVEEGWLPDDVVRYSRWRAVRDVPKSVRPVPAKKARGMYLQNDALHYTVGTRITPRIAEDLDTHGFGEVYASQEKPPVEPVMIRVHGVPLYGEDWLARMGTTYLKRQLDDSVMRARDTDTLENWNFVPTLASGGEFARNVERTGKF